jgi:LysR family transcriptional regulator, low CO2-responsive transcriptional regulator
VNITYAIFDICFSPVRLISIPPRGTVVTLHQLKIFLIVAKRQSIKAASEELRAAQPSISRQLQLLASDVGTKLHHRVGQGIELTPAGRFFVREAGIIVSRVERLKTTLGRQVSRKIPETLNVGGTYAASASLLPKIMARFARNYPRVKLHLRTRDGLVLERMVLKGEVDLVIIHHRPAHRQLTAEPYGTEPLAAFVAPNHPLAPKRRLLWDDLGQVGFVTRKPLHEQGTSERYLQSLKKHGLEPMILMHCDSPEAVKTVVLRNNGVGILFRRVVEENIKRGDFKEIKLPKNGQAFAGKSFIVYHKVRPLSFCAQDFLKLLRKNRKT